MFTEDEAREKYCVQSISTGERTCGGSVCMAWRWDRVLVPVKHETLTCSKLRDSTTHGYCGLAGMP